MSWAAVIAGGASIGGSLIAANASKQAATRAGQKSQVDIDQLNELTKRIATQNAIDSSNLERRLTPEVPLLRQAANSGVLSGLDPSTNGYAQQAAAIQKLLEQQQGVAGTKSYGTVDQPSSLDTPLLRSAIAEAGEQLRLGGSLSPELQNLITRRSLAQGGTVAGAGGGLGLGRDLVARDLGTTSLSLQQQRLQQALGAGQLEQGLGMAQQGFATNRLNNQLNADQAAFGMNLATNQNTTGNQLNLLSLMQQLQGGQFNRQLAAAQYGQSIRQPIVGLDPSSAANIAVGNQNAQGAALTNQANIYGQQAQNYANLGGQFAGYGLINYNQRQKPPAVGTASENYINYGTVPGRTPGY